MHGIREEFRYSFHAEDDRRGPRFTCGAIHRAGEGYRTDKTQPLKKTQSHLVTIVCVEAHGQTVR